MLTCNFLSVRTFDAVFKAKSDVILKCEVVGITSWTRPIEWKKGDEVVKADNSRIFINDTTTGSLLDIRNSSKLYCSLVRQLSMFQRRTK